MMMNQMPIYMHLNYKYLHISMQGSVVYILLQKNISEGKCTSAFCQFTIIMNIKQEMCIQVFCLYAFILIVRKYKYYQKILSKHETIFAMLSYLCVLDITCWRIAHSDNFIITQQQSEHETLRTLSLWYFSIKVFYVPLYCILFGQ